MPAESGTSILILRAWRRGLSTSSFLFFSSSSCALRLCAACARPHLWLMGCSVLWTARRETPDLYTRSVQTGGFQVRRQHEEASGYSTFQLWGFSGLQVPILPAVWHNCHASATVFVWRVLKCYFSDMSLLGKEQFGDTLAAYKYGISRPWFFFFRIPSVLRESAS